jgi:hypothetical protein
MHHLDLMAQTQIEHHRHAIEARAQRAHAIREALTGQGGRIAFYKPLLVSIGVRLVKMGTELQARYGNLQPHSGAVRLAVQNDTSR